MAEGRRPAREQPRARVIYALPDRQETADVLIEEGMDVAAAVQRSGLLERFPEIRSSPLACAIYGQPAPLTRRVRAGDRIEILRALAIDPKEGRRQAAARARSGAKTR